MIRIIMGTPSPMPKPNPSFAPLLREDPSYSSTSTSPGLSGFLGSLGLCGSSGPFGW